MSFENDNRKHDRKQVDVLSNVSVDGHETTLKIKDLSEGGAFVRKGDAPIPPIGTEIFVEIPAVIEGDEPLVAQAKVVRVTADGFAIIFLE